MSTTLSMPSPHGHHAALSHGGAFATSLQLSPAFRSLHAAALRQRQHEFQRLSELARSDEFSDDESDGDEEEEEAEDEEEEEAEDDEDDDEEEEEDDDEEMPEVQEAEEEEEEEPLAHDSDIDTDETVLLPFVRPTVAGAAQTDLMSPKADEWTIVDKSPTCEGLVYGNVDVSETWFARP